MTDSLVHRGPDDSGCYLSGNLGLGFRRLSIIDLSSGHQPMANPERNVWVVFNGEIYNYRELRRELQSYGHDFRTQSDTEVIVHGYEQWGFDLLGRLNGMFGVAIWDETKKKLILARDRAGIKLVYYKLTSGELLFGSEIRPILSGLEESPEIDPVALNLFLRYRYVPSPITLYQGIRKLAPGTSLVVEDGKVEERRYWNFKPVPFDPMPSVEDAEEELLGLYKQAVRRQLMSDVPLGLLLSGGLDSGLLLALMNLEGDHWKTFTVGYGSDRFFDDEMEEAAGTARVLRAPNVGTAITREDFETILPKLVDILEEPVASPSIVPMYYLCKRARRDVKVALMGQGPDELMGGYTRHVGIQYGKYWRAVPRPLQGATASVLRTWSNRETIWRGLASLGENDRLRRYGKALSLVPEDELGALFQDEVVSLQAKDLINDCWNGLPLLMEHVDELNGFNFLEVRSSLPDELLMYADKISMHHSLETRVPYLDHDIIEYVERLDSSFKVRNGSRKWLHRRVCKRFLPKVITSRKKKGFACNVVDQWFRESMEGKFESLLLDPQSLLYDLVKHDKVKVLISEHKSGDRDHHKILFSLLVAEEWLRNRQQSTCSSSVVGEMKYRTETSSCLS